MSSNSDGCRPRFDREMWEEFFFFSFILNVGTVGIESMLVSLPKNGISGVLGGGGGRIGR